MDLKLDSTGDLDITNNRLSFVTGIDYIAQSWRIRCLTILGEWFLDQRIGIPYFQHILVKNPNWNLIRSIYRKTTYSVSGIKEIIALKLNLNSATRTLDVEVQGKTEDLTTFKFSFSEFILSKNREVTP